MLIILNYRTLHTTTETAIKSRYHPYTLQLFFTTATIFATVLYMGNVFHNDYLFGKIVVKIYCSVRRP